MLDRIWTAVSNQWLLFLAITVAVTCLLAIFVIFLPRIRRLEKQNQRLERENVRLAGVASAVRKKGQITPPPNPLAQLIGGVPIDGPARLNSKSEARGNVRGAFLAIEMRSSCQNLVPCGCTQVQPMFEDRALVDDDGDPATSQQRVQCVDCGAERPII